MSKKVVFMISLAISLLYVLSFVSATPNLKVDAIPVSDVVVDKLSNPAEFDLVITNLGKTEQFEVFSLVSVDILPTTNFEIQSSETKTIRIQVFPYQSIRSRPGYYTFTYDIYGLTSGVKEDRLTIKIAGLDTLFDISADNIYIGKDSEDIQIKNTEMTKIDNVDFKLSSVFFTKEGTLSFLPYEEKNITISLDKDKVKTLVAGPYTLATEVIVNGTSTKYSSTIKLTEKSEISSSDETDGIIVRTRTIKKINDGNIPTLVEINVKKDVISRLLTNFNIQPGKSERSGFFVSYTWGKELKPAEVLEIKVKTNYILPLIIIIVIIAVAVLAVLFIEPNLSFKKRVVFVRTKGGEFALKVIITIRAKKFLENINIIDRIPPSVKLYEQFGAMPPDKIDERNRRLEWNIPTLDSGEVRVLSYIIYSKIGVIGQFVLPSATVIYEKAGKVIEAMSNRAIFASEQRRS